MLLDQGATEQSVTPPSFWAVLPAAAPIRHIWSDRACEQHVSVATAQGSYGIEVVFDFLGILAVPMGPNTRKSSYVQKHCTSRIIQFQYIHEEFSNTFQGSDTSLENSDYYDLENIGTLKCAVPILDITHCHKTCKYVNGPGVPWPHWEWELENRCMFRTTCPDWPTACRKYSMSGGPKVGLAHRCCCRRCCSWLPKATESPVVGARSSVPSF